MKPDSHSKSYVGRLTARYLQVYPDFTFPNNLDKKTQLEALVASNGRRLVFVKKGLGYEYFFEPSEEPKPEKLENFKRLLGCGP